MLEYTKQETPERECQKEKKVESTGHSARDAKQPRIRQQLGNLGVMSPVMAQRCQQCWAGMFTPRLVPAWPGSPGFRRVPSRESRV